MALGQARHLQQRCGHHRLQAASTAEPAAQEVPNAMQQGAAAAAGQQLQRGRVAGRDACGGRTVMCCLTLG
jgi:hypothetical protein